METEFKGLKKSLILLVIGLVCLVIANCCKLTDDRFSPVWLILFIAFQALTLIFLLLVTIKLRRISNRFIYALITFIIHFSLMVVAEVFSQSTNLLQATIGKVLDFSYHFIIFIFYIYYLLGLFAILKGYESKEHIFAFFHIFRNR